MTTRLALLAFALVGVTGLAHAQSASTMPLPMHSKTTQMAKGSEVPTPTAKKGRPHETQAMARACSQRQKVAMTDEYGFHYDSRGDRLNAQDCVIAPPHTLHGAKVLQD